MFLVPLNASTQALTRQLDRLFDDSLLEGMAPSSGAAASPALDVTETDKGYTVQMDLPGVLKEDVKVQIEGRRVRISAEKRAGTPQDGERVLLRERTTRRLARHFTLPQDIDQTASQARLDQGVLTLLLAKRQASNAHELPIQ